MSARVLRTALALGLVGAVGVSGLAEAARRPKPRAVAPVCHLLTDPAGDATGGLLSTANEPAWDILSGDIATNGTLLTTVIRVAKLSKAAGDPVGSQWRFDFVVGGVKLYTQATSTPFGDKFLIGYTDTTSHSFANSGATGIFDLANNEVRVTAPLAAAATQAKITVGTKLTGLAASDGDYINVAGGSPSLSFSADTTDPGKDYVAGTPSCVVIGK